MNIRQFLDPTEEEAVERSDEILEAIVACHQAEREIESSVVSSVERARKYVLFDD